MISRSPHMKYEQRLWREGLKHIVGVDEVGRGAWAGPIVAAAVVLPPKPRIYGIRDSKKLSPKKREVLAKRIQERAIAYSVAMVPAHEIDAIGISAANELAMRHSVEQLSVQPDFVLLDAFSLTGFNVRQSAIPHGDLLIYSIAAASIVAKVARDAYMKELHESYPDYGFASSKGYGTQAHRAALQQYGVTEVHRRSFQPMVGMI